MSHLFASISDWQTLKRNSSKVYSGNHLDRANWMELYYLSGACSDLHHNSDEIYERFGITDRVRDSCGEMNDCEEVIAEMMKRIEQNPSLSTAIREAEGQNILNHWRTIARNVRQTSLF